MSSLSVEVIHRLPGRLRVRMSRPPVKVDTFLSNVIKHKGIIKLTFNPISKSLIAEYTPSLIASTEILLRISIALSAEHHGQAVKMDVKRNITKLTLLDYYSGSSILLALANKMINLPLQTQVWLNYNAGLSTAAAVLSHAWHDVKKEGIYDPEVVSVVYLINSLIKGNFLVASAITWAATFGRHILEPSEESCCLKAIEVNSEGNKTYMDVEIQEVVDASANNPLKFIVQSLSRMIGLKPIEKQRLINSIRHVSRAHHDVLESIGRKPSPVYMRIEY